jgi:hypothetical protein
MYTKQALRETRGDRREMSEAQRRSLDENGFFIQEGVFHAGAMPGHGRGVRSAACSARAIRAGRRCM